MKKKILSIGIIFIFVCLVFIPNLSADIYLSDKIERLEDNCKYNDIIRLDFPIICWVLERLWYLIPQFSPFPVPLLHWVIIVFAEILGCTNIPP